MANIGRYLAQSAGHTLAVGISVRGARGLYEFNSEHAHYDIGSISKTFTALLAFKLVGEGKLDVRAAVNEYLPVKGRLPTIANLLSHTAGYGHLTPAELTLPNLMRHRYERRNPYERANEEIVLRCLRRRNRFRERGRYSYSDFDYALLGMAVECAAGKPFCALLQDFIDVDLSLKGTFLLYNGGRNSCFRGKIIPDWNWSADNPYLAAGGITSCVQDMLNYVEIQLKSEQDFVLQAQSPCLEAAPSRERVRPCFGWLSYEDSQLRWHAGGVGTHRSAVLFNRRRGIGIVVLTNAQGIRGANALYLAKEIYTEIRRNRLPV